MPHCMSSTKPCIAQLAAYNAAAQASLGAAGEGFECPMHYTPCDSQVDGLCLTAAQASWDDCRQRQLELTVAWTA